MSVPLSSTFHVSLIFNLSTTAESLANRLNRRKSVFAESYDPEGDDDEGEKVFPIKLLWYARNSTNYYVFLLCNWQVVYPKSDQQRHRLAEAVKNIFLFRSLDPVSQSIYITYNFFFVFHAHIMTSLTQLRCLRAQIGRRITFHVRGGKDQSNYFSFSLLIIYPSIYVCARLVLIRRLGSCEKEGEKRRTTSFPFVTKAPLAVDRSLKTVGRGGSFVE